MRLAAWAAIAVRHRRTVILLAILTTFAGVALLIDRPEGVALEWIAPSLLVVGGSVFAWGVWPRGPPNSEAPQSVATRLLRRLTWNGRLVPFFPVFGVAIVLTDLGYNIALSATPALQTEDTIVLLAAAALLGYTLVPPRFARERDFVLVFSLCLNAILVLPLLAARAYYANFERSVDVYSWVALAPQTSAVLTLLGVSNSVHEVAGLTAPGLTFTPQHIPAQVTVVITTACSGIYSFGIFASAFVAFIMTEYETLSWRVWVLLGLGLLTAYVANVLRMVVIVLVGYYTDTTETDLQNMLVAHSYAGWIIFLGWLAVFWGLLFRFLPSGRMVPVESRRSETPARVESMCGICLRSLTPMVPATRCACGAYYHRTCLASAGRCPSCRRPPRVKGGTVA